MNERRPIKDQEYKLIVHLLKQIEKTVTDYPLSRQVYEYEGGKMGSISLGEDGAEYLDDLIQGTYLDVDLTPVVITLTQDTRKQLLDLDFWKTDFSKLIRYPKPEQVFFE